MKFKLDENMPTDLAALLQEHGHDVTNAVEEGLVGKADEVVLEAATEEGRVLFTFDTDFANIREYPPGTHAGIVVFRLKDQRWKPFEKAVTRLLGEGTLKGLARGLAIVDEVRVRIRRTDRK